MHVEERHITFDELAADVAGFVNRVVREGAEIVVETEDGASVAIVPRALSRPKSEVDIAAFRAAAGSWADVDTDAFLAEIYARRASSRPAVDL
jgi:hypothetical protein